MPSQAAYPASSLGSGDAQTQHNTTQHRDGANRTDKPGGAKTCVHVRYDTTYHPLPAEALKPLGKD